MCTAELSWNDVYMRLSTVLYTEFYCSEEYNDKLFWHLDRLVTEWVGIKNRSVCYLANEKTVHCNHPQLPPKTWNKPLRLETQTRREGAVLLHEIRYVRLMAGLNPVIFNCFQNRSADGRTWIWYIKRWILAKSMIADRFRSMSYTR